MEYDQWKICRFFKAKLLQKLTNNIDQKEQKDYSRTIK